MAARYRALCDCGWVRTYDSHARATANLARHVCPRDDGVRRATRHHRCARCGYEETYHNAGAKEARYWFARHSCRKREEAMLRAAMREARMEAIDRTPKPCLHKQANHQHGTNACYVLDGCRCEPCSHARMEQDRWRARQKAYGRYTRYVNADAVREHVRSLMDAGMGLKRIVKVSGVSQGALWKLMYGKRQPDGSQTPSRRVLRDTAERLYALDPAWNGPLDLADGARVPADEARRRVRALVALGWSQSKIAAALGITRANFRVADDACTHITVATDKAIAALYADWSTRLPPQTDQRERIAASRARNYAKAHGWPPPLASAEHNRQEVHEDDAYEPRWAKGKDGIWRAAS